MKYLTPFKFFLPEIIAFIFASAVFLFKLQSSFSFHSDLGRDSLAMWNILHGDMTLLGPKTSFGGIYVGPYYFYMFAPFLLLFHYHPFGIVFGNALLFIVSYTLAFYLLRKKTSLPFASLAILWIGITSYFLFSARNVTNASTYLAPLLIYFVLLLYYFPFKKHELISLVGFGFAAGVIANIHPASLIVSLPFTLAMFFLRKPTKILKKIIFYLVGFAAAFAPIVLFEVTHGFIMTKNTFINKSYEMFTQNQNAVAQLPTSKNIFLNVLNISGIVDAWIHPALISLIVGLVIMAIILRRNQEIIWLAGIFIANLLLYSFLFRFQAVQYYLFPLLVLTQALVIYFLGRLNQTAKCGVLIFLVLMSIIYFPANLYLSTSRSYEKILKNTKAAVEQMPVELNHFNIVEISSTPITILGQEYRYALKNLGLTADDMFAYNSSQYLLMISEIGYIDAENQRSWEIDQFGPKKLLKSMKVGDEVWYVFKKI